MPIGVFPETEIPREEGGTSDSPSSSESRAYSPKSFEFELSRVAAEILERAARFPNATIVRRITPIAGKEVRNAFRPAWAVARVGRLGLHRRIRVLIGFIATRRTSGSPVVITLRVPRLGSSPLDVASGARRSWCKPISSERREKPPALLRNRADPIPSPLGLDHQPAASRPRAAVP